MKVSAFFAACLSLGIAWQVASAAPADTALQNIERAELARRFEPSIASYLGGEPRVAARAALAIGRIHDMAGVAPLERCLGAVAPSLRAMCAYGLGLLGDPNGLDAIRELARHDANSAVRYAAVDAIGRIALVAPSLGTHDVMGDLETVMSSDADPVVRAHAAAQLDVFANAPFAPYLAGRLQRAVDLDGDQDVRWHAMWALYRGFATNADPNFLRDALRDPNELVRVEAVRAWARRTDAPTATIERLAANDPSWRVQLQALETLRAIRHEPATEHLIALQPGVHLPPLDATAGASPPGPEPSGFSPAPIRERSGPLAALRATSLPLAAASFPVTAQQMNGAFAATHPRALIRTTKGDVVVRLYPEWAPSTVANFLTLGSRGYYDGNRWFRIVPDFVVQTGDARDDPDGNPGYTIPAEENPVEQRSGVIAMGLEYKDGKAVRDSAGAQYYLTLSPQLHLNRAFTVFGEIETGANVLAHLVESDRVIGVRRIADETRAAASETRAAAP